MLGRPGPAEAAIDLAQLAGRGAAAALCEIVSRRDSTLIAHGVELLLEHQSIPSIESVARMALALKKERTVSSRVPPLKEAF